MPTQLYPDQQVPLNSKTHNSLRHLNPPDPRHPRSIISQTEFANSIIPVPPIGLIVLLRLSAKMSLNFYSCRARSTKSGLIAISLITSPDQEQIAETLNPAHDSTVFVVFSSKNYGHLDYIYNTRSLPRILLIEEIESAENRDWKLKTEIL